MATQIEAAIYMILAGSPYDIMINTILGNPELCSEDALYQHVGNLQEMPTGHHINRGAGFRESKFGRRLMYPLEVLTRDISNGVRPVLYINFVPDTHVGNLVAELGANTADKGCQTETQGVSSMDDHRLAGGNLNFTPDPSHSRDRRQSAPSPIVKCEGVRVESLRLGNMHHQFLAASGNTADDPIVIDDDDSDADDQSSSDAICKADITYQEHSSGRKSR